MKKLFVIAIMIVTAYIVLQLAGNKPNLQTISQDKVSREAVHKIDDLLMRRMSVIVRKKQEDELLSNQYIEDYKDEISRSKAIISYFQKRQEIMRGIKKEIDEGSKELDLLFSKYKKGESGYQLINAFRNYFYAYKHFMDAAYKDIEDKVQASIMYKTIALLESNEQAFYDTLDKSDLQEAKRLLDREGELIANYKQNIDKIHYKSRIPDKWKQEFVETYILMYEWDKNIMRQKNRMT